MAKATQRAPAHLSPASRALWRATMAAYDLEPHAVRLLTMACEASDQVEEARAEVAKSGSFGTDRFGKPKAHPAIAVGRDASIRAARLFRELQLGPEPEEPRVPRSPGY